MSMSITIETDIVFPGKSDEDHCKKENNEEETTKDENNTDDNTSNALFTMKYLKKEKYFLNREDIFLYLFNEPSWPKRDSIYRIFSPHYKHIPCKI